MNRFLHHGGAVDEVERGLSGRTGNDAPIKSEPALFQEPKAQRTHIPEVLAAIDARRSKKHTPAPKASKQPRKKIIYDDFGEPLRWEWVKE
jgi:hypothetical protein